MTDPRTATRQRLDEIAEAFRATSQRAVGHPGNLAFDYSELAPFLNLGVNNVGDPFHDSNFGINSHEVEREVIRRFAELVRLPQGEAWGYVTNGGTEGNMYGLFLARELYPDGIVYFSEDAHYSSLKIMRVLDTRNIMIKSQPSGEIDYDDLRESIRVNRDVPAIFMASIGTTMTGAADDVTRVAAILDDLAITRRYVHADAALAGMILPFVDDPQPHTFADGIDSIAISGHKLIGAPIPCGVALTRKEHVTRIARSIEYVGVMDTTLTGSRNGLTPLMLWLAWERHGEAGFRAIVRDMLAVAAYAVERFNALGVAAWRNRNSPVVVMPRPADDVLAKWQLMPHRDIAHIVVMPHVTRAMIDEIADDLAAARPAAQPA